MEVNLTTVPAAKEAAQVGEQVIPTGLERTVPEPVPAGVIVSRYVAGGGADWATATTQFSNTKLNKTVIKGAVIRVGKAASLQQLKYGQGYFWMSWL